MRLLHLLPRLLISIGIPLVLFAADTAFEWRDYQSAWQADWQERTQVYASNLERCERIRIGLLPDSGMKCESSQSSASNQTSGEDFPPGVFALLDKESCELHKKGDTKALLRMFKCDVKATPPNQDPFRAYTWEDQLKQKGTLFALAAIAIFVTMTAIKLYLNQRSIGWKRLSVVAAAVTSAIISYFLERDTFFDSLEQVIGSVLVFAAGFMILSLALLLSKSIFDWIREGFGVDRGNSSPPTIKASRERIEVRAEEERHEKDPLTGVAASNSSIGVISDVTSSSTSNAMGAKRSRTDDEVWDVVSDVTSSSTSNAMDAKRSRIDDEVSESVLKDVDSPKRIDALWERCLAEADGDTNKAKASYIKIRFEQMVLKGNNGTAKEG